MITGLVVVELWMCRKFLPITVVLMTRFSRVIFLDICIDKIEIGDDVMFAWGCTIMDNNAHSLVWEQRQNDVLDWKRGLDEDKTGFYKNWNGVKSAPIIIKNKAWIGFNCIILKGVTIGEGAVLGAGSVVTESVPDYAVVAGNPAKIIKYTR